jgi:hypothetical protein
VELQENMALESRSAPARVLVLRDLPWLGFNRYSDRGLAIEQAWESNTKLALRTIFSTLADDELAGWRPSLVFAPMLVEDGRRLLISNLDLSHLLETKGSQFTGKDVKPDATHSLSAVQLYDLFPQARETLRLSTAARMNASFPYVSPAGVLPIDPPRRVADAGYYDNYGVNVAAQWLTHLAHPPDDSQKDKLNWLRENVSQVVLVQIRDQKSEHDRTHLAPEKKQASSVGSRGLHWLATPFHAVMSARDSTMSFRNDEQLQELGMLLNRDGSKDFFTTITFELNQPASLSWYLTKDEITRIRADMSHEDNRKRVVQLRKLLSGP